MTAPPTDLPILKCTQASCWANWLAKHHATSPGLWLRMAKKDSALASVSYAQALEAALCYGWIDGQRKSHDEQSWLQKFTPRAAHCAVRADAGAWRQALPLSGHAPAIHPPFLMAQARLH